MQKATKNNYTREDYERLLKRIPFFNDVLKQSDLQFYNLLDLADLVEVEPGETVIRKGDNDVDLYFLLRGQLAVFLDDSPSTVPVSFISPGEVFGILTMITNTPRSAFIKADVNSKATLLYKLNSAQLIDETFSSRLSLDTKLIFYRMATHNIRWMLEQKKMADPKHPLVSEMLKLPYVLPTKGTKEELMFLKQQAKSLAEILFKWNNYATMATPSDADKDADKTVIRNP